MEPNLLVFSPRRLANLVILCIFLSGWLSGGVFAVQAYPQPPVIDRPVLVVRGDYDYPPYEFIQNGQPSGFNIDLIRAVARVMGYDVQISLGPWNEVRADLEERRIDVLAGMYYSEERDQRVDFSTPHVSVSPGLFVRKGSSIRSLDDLRDKAVLVQEGDIMHDYLLREKITAAILPVSEPAEALRILASGNQDAVLLSSLIQGLYFKDEYNLSNLITVPTDLPSRRYCFAVQEGNQKLLQDLNEGLNILHKTGQYDEIYNQWFGQYEAVSLFQNRYVFGALAVLAVLLIFSFLWSASLRSQVARRTAELRKSEEKYRLLFDQVPIGLYRSSPEGTLLDANQAAVQMLKYPSREQLLKIKTQNLYVNRQDRLRWQQEIEQAGGTGQFEVEILRFDGRSIWVRDHTHVTRGSDGSVLFYEGSLEDITQEKHNQEEIRSLNADLEKRVIERTRQLEESTREIEAFTYSVSHDLRAPLRAIDGFAHLIQTEFSAPLPPEARTLLGRMQENVDQMSRLIDDLLMFIRIGRKKLAPQRLRMSEIVKQTLEELSAEHAGRQVEFLFGDLPDCQADPILLKQALHNLLSNALKFTRVRPRAQIEMGFIYPLPENRETIGFLEGEKGCYFIRDNGVGFDMQYMDKLFGIFQRLHSPEEYEGTGIGLANAQRIFKRHRGRVWAQSEVNRGATFYFTLEEICL